MDQKECQKQFMQGLSKASTGAKVSNYLAVNLFNTQSKQTQTHSTTTPPKASK